MAPIVESPLENSARKCEERADTETCKTIVHESFQNYRNIICQISIILIVIEDIYLYEKILQPFGIGKMEQNGWCRASRKE